MNVRNNARGGFTLVEILLVIAIIGIVAGAMILTLTGRQEKATADSAKVLIENVCTALDLYKLDIGHYPSEEEGGLDALTKKPAFTDEKLAEKWTAAYLKQEPVDGWGKKLGYEVTDPSNEEAKTLPYKVWSFGPNMQDDNGSGDDIRNKAWQLSDPQQ